MLLRRFEDELPRHPGQDNYGELACFRQEINGVAANNDEMALGALQAIKVAKKLGRSTAGATLSTSTFSFGSLP